MGAAADRIAMARRPADHKNDITGTGITPLPQLFGKTLTRERRTSFIKRHDDPATRNTGQQKFRLPCPKLGFGQGATLFNFNEMKWWLQPIGIVAKQHL